MTAGGIRTVGVVGLGAMGAGIAQLAIEAGFATIGHELDADAGEAARVRIAHFLARKVDKGQLEADARDAALDRLRLSTDLSQLAGCELVIEAAFEELAVKHELFRALEDVVSDETILATNTSALSVTEIAIGAGVAGTRSRDALLQSRAADAAGRDRARRANGRAGCRRRTRVRRRASGRRRIDCFDTPGFVVNRVLIPLLNDCVRVLDEAGITPEDLDARR